MTNLHLFLQAIFSWLHPLCACSPASLAQRKLLLLQYSTSPAAIALLALSPVCKEWPCLTAMSSALLSQLLAMLTAPRKTRGSPFSSRQPCFLPGPACQLSKLFGLGLSVWVSL